MIYYYYYLIFIYNIVIFNISGKLEEQSKTIRGIAKDIFDHIINYAYCTAKLVCVIPIH